MFQAMSAQIIETEETLIIETPERVPLAFALASIGNRFIAVAVDHAIQFTSVGVVVLIFLFAAGVFSTDEPTVPGGFGSHTPNWIIAVMVIVLSLLFAG